MAKYVFVNVPAYGHVNPTLGVVQELVKRGEEVVYFLTEEFREAVEATGATLRPYRPFGEKPPSSTPPQQGAPFGGKPPQHGAPGGAGRPGGGGPFEGPIEMLERVRDEHPDYIVYDAMHLWARTIAEILHVPAILSCPSFVANEQFNPLKDHFNLLGDQLAAPTQIPAGFMEMVQGVITAVRGKFNLSPFDMKDFYTHAEKLNIVYMPRAFQPSGELFDERYVFAGPSLVHRGEDVPYAEKTEKRTLYISLGTVYNDRPEFFKQCYAAFGQGSWEVVVAQGKQAEEQEPVAENIHVEGYVEQWKIFPRTGVFVTHGGMNSVMESLYYGVPMVVIPQQAEQAMTARRIVELGLGVALDPDQLTAEKLQEAVEKVYSDAAIRERVQVMQHLVRQAGGGSRAADAIISFAREHASATSI